MADAGGLNRIARQFSGPQIANAITAGVFVAILGIMLGNIPPNILSMLLVINIALSLLILMLGIYVERPLDFSAFPSVLLMMTLFRLALNVASTKLILTSGGPNVGLNKAGAVIQFFGEVVAGNNPVIGFVIFIILIIIQAIVITKGATRIAEVAARFTLDAMPGKQMAIDADLNAGLITEAEARSRRAMISREADFYGAMDGASKFVRGDVIAGIIITVVNIIGGIFVGLIQEQLPIFEVLRRYTILTIGDGLVSQIPSLMVSTAAGVVVTRAATDEALGVNLAQQIFARPEAMFAASSALALIATIGAVISPSIVPFFLIAALIVAGGAYFRRHLEAMKRKKEEEHRREEEEVAAEVPEAVERLLEVDPMEIEIGYALIPVVDAQQGGDLLDRVSAIRRQTAIELGIVVPPIRIRDNMQLPPRVYVIRIRGNEMARGELRPDRLLAMHPSGQDTEEDIPGIKTREPAFGLPAKWIEKDERARAEMAGYQIIEPAAVLATHLSEVIKNNAHELLGRQEVQELLDNLKERNPVLVKDVLETVHVKVGVIQKTLQNLLRERVPIRNLEVILETISDYAESANHNPDTLSEYCRIALARTITHAYLDQSGKLPVISLDPRIETKLLDAMQKAGPAGIMAVDPGYGERLVGRILSEADRVISQGLHPVLITSPQIRAHLKRMCERRIPSLVVLSFNEVAAEVNLRRVGTIPFEDAPRKAEEPAGTPA
ncbi:MAG TPA: flagellar biosynthesis protein FlhA [bacterium]|nr:flagellar biosynthesis protein FlhA [bacterium]HQL61746.1 flagellar biosynthesis protein FlhA [bacterium]